MKYDSLRKSLTVVVISILVFSVLGAMTAVEGAGISDQELTPNEEYGWLSAVEVDGEMSYTGDEPDKDCFVGEKEVTMRPRFNENLTDQPPSEAANITHSEVLTNEIKRLDGDDWQSMNSSHWVNASENFEWTVDTIYEDTGAFTGEEFIAGNFEFDVPNEATPGIYRIPIDMRITNYSADTNQWYGPHADLEYVWLELAGNAVIGNLKLKSGVEFAEGSVTVLNQANTDLNDVNLELDETDLQDGDGNQATIHDPDDTTYVDEILENNAHNMDFRFTVPREMSPGDYEVDYTLTATREEDGKRVTEEGEITITIEEVVELTAEIQENEVMQGNTRETFSVEFTNTGNLDLERIEVRAETDGEFFFVPKDYYEDGQAQSESAFKEIGDLEKGESNSTEFVLGMKKQLQIGKHKIDFDYSAYHYDEDGEITGESVYIETGTEYDPEDLLAPSEEPTDFIEVNENPDYTPLSGGRIGIERNFAIQEIRVTDTGYQEIVAEIENNGEVRYEDVTVEMDLDNTPFTSVDTTDQTVMMKEDPFTLTPGETIEVTFGVNVESSVIETMLEEDSPTFQAELHITGMNQDSVQEVEKTVMGEGQVAGLGPKLKVTPPEEEEIPVGETFELEYEIMNVGDEPVYDLEVMITPTVGTEVTHEFSDADEALYYRQASIPPGASISNVEPAQTTLQPGESTTVTFQMRSSNDIKYGDIYYYNLDMMGETRDGEQTWQSVTSVQAEQKEEPEPIVSPAILAVTIPLIVLVIVVALLYKMEMAPFSSEGEEQEEETEFEEIEEVPPEEEVSEEDIEEPEEEAEEVEFEEEQEGEGFEEESEEESPWGDSDF